jgi:hypothetical protein
MRSFAPDPGTFPGAGGRRDFEFDDFPVMGRRAILLLGEQIEGWLRKEE